MTHPITLLIALPIPPRALSPNVRSHWAAKARAVERYRALACQRACRMLRKEKMAPPLYGRAYVEIEWEHKTARLPDKDNIVAWLKSGIDGLTDAGIFKDDRDVDYASPRVSKAADGRPPAVYLYVTGTDDAVGDAMPGGDDLAGRGGLPAVAADAEAVRHGPSQEAA